MDEVVVDPETLAASGSTVLEVSMMLGRGAMLSAAALETIASDSAGNVAAGPTFVTANAACAGAAAGALESLVATLEAASEALFACAFGYSTTDELVARRLES